MQAAKVAVIFFSETGTTARLAQAVRDGASEVAKAVLWQIDPADIVAGRFTNGMLLQAADTADTLAFGTPTYMGGPAAQFKAFADATGDRWAAQRWAGKIAGGFTTGSCPNGDQGHTLAYLAVFAAQHGMLWCGLDIPGGTDAENRNRLGTQLGVATHAANGALEASDVATARHLGRRLGGMRVTAS